METSFLSCNNSLPQISEQKIHTSKQSHFTKRSPKKISFADHNLNTLSKNGQLKEAVIALDTIAKTGNKISSDTYISLLQSCIDFNSIDQGRKIHTQIHLVNDPNPFVETKLISMYAKCGSLEDARQVFDEMSERNLFTWSAMIGGYTREQRWREIIKLFVWMMWEGIVPDEFLLPKVLQACGNVGDIRVGRLVHCFVIRGGLNSSVHVNNALVSMYAKCGELGDARRCFENVEIRNRVTWNAIISAYCHCGENEEALRLFDQMQREGLEPGLITWNILISSYIQLGNCDLAVGIMKKMDGEGISPDVFTWTSMISGCAQSNRPEQALDFFRQMVLSGVEPNGVTIASGVSVCASLKALKQGMELHSIGIKLGSMGDVLLGNSLIEMYSKCGNLEAARGIFDAMSEKDVVTWNSMIGGYTQAGYFSKAYDLFTRMQNSSIKPNVITWNVMISGYIQKGDEDQAMDLFKRMEMDGIIKRNAASWNALISGFLQNGQTSKAFRVFRQMQSCSTLPNSITMLSILPACANLVESKKIKEIHGSILRGRIELEISVANKLIDAYAKSGYMHYARCIFEDLPSRDVISWNIIISAYVLHGRPSIALELFQRMKLVGPRPNRGTFASIIMAYSLAGMVDEGNNAFSSMSTDYQISLGSEHYSAMVDLLGRAYRLGEAANFIDEMGIEEDSAVWDALLTASRVHGNLGLAVRAAERLFEVEPKNSNVYRLLLQLYALSGQSEEALKLIKPKRRGGTDNSSGSSSFENKNKVHIIMTGDRSVENSDGIYAQLASIREEIKIMHFDSSEAQLCISEEENEEICGVHSEKLAILSALISTPCSSQSIRIIKNFRMCIDCHNTAKFISLKYGREIYLYDNKCFHHFENGQCSCKDYW